MECMMERLTDGAYTFSCDGIVVVVASVVELQAFDVPVSCVATAAAVACMLRKVWVSAGILSGRAILLTPPELASLRPP